MQVVFGHGDLQQQQQLMSVTEQQTYKSLVDPLYLFSMNCEAHQSLVAGFRFPPTTLQDRPPTVIASGNGLL
ncbi:MAG: hypothetical protein FRX49_00703 [Trebouxia sp. A1-2]|nr:MAG: hypothetical protein FRX49_00703 [Trebouxia sp. A1-2]